MQQTIDNISYFTLGLPEIGKYRMILYAKDASQAPSDKEHVFSGVGEYEIVFCEQGQEVPTPYPPCAHTSWGPGDSFDHYKLTTHQKNAIVNTNTGVTEIRMSMVEPLRVNGKLQAVGYSSEDLAPYVLTRVGGIEAVFIVHAPYPGEFGLEIYANSPAVDGQTLHHVYQYLIVNRNVDKRVEPFPAVIGAYLGPQPAFEGLGLTCGLADPYVEVDTGDTQVSFHSAKPVRMSSQLLFIPPGAQPEDLSDYVLQQTAAAGKKNDRMATFVVKLPKPGMYKLQFFGLPITDQSESLPGIYNVLIHCRNTVVDLAPFPKQYAPWKEDCYLHEPLEGHLQPNRPTQGSASSYQNVFFFRMSVPKATSVAVVVGGEWFPLEEEQEACGGRKFHWLHIGARSVSWQCAPAMRILRRATGLCSEFSM